MLELNLHTCGHKEVTYLRGTPKNRQGLREHNSSVRCSLCLKKNSGFRPVIIEHACGHIEAHKRPIRDKRISPQVQNATWRAELEAKICIYCNLENKYAKCLRILEEDNFELPPLEGSPDQIEWVRRIQGRAFVELHEEGNPTELILFVFSLIKSCDEWIDYRDVIVDQLEEELFIALFGKDELLSVHHTRSRKPKSKKRCDY